MDINNNPQNSIPQNLIKALEEKNTAQLVALSRVLNLMLGKTVAANVTSTAPVTPQEREELLKQTAAALTQLAKQTLNPATVTPAIKAEIARLVQQQNLIQSPELKWVGLLVNNRPLMTYTDKPLTVGQTIPVQLQSPQKLVLLDLPELELTKLLSTNINSTAIAENELALNTTTSTLLKTTANTALNNFVKIANEAVLNESLVDEFLKSPNATAANLSPTKNILPTTTAQTTFTTATTTSLGIDQTSSKNTMDLNLSIKQLVANNLRQLLPIKDTPAVLFSAVNQWQQVSIERKQELISPTLEQALKSLAAQIRLPEQLSQPRVLAQIFKSTGTFFENKLNNAINTAVNNSISSDGLQKNPLNTSTTIARTYSQDTKGALLNLVSKVTQELNGNQKPLSTDQTLKLLQQINSYIATSPAPYSSQPTLSKNDSAVNLGQLIQQIMTKPVSELSDKELRTQLLVLLQQHSVHSLAKIQLQQLHTINQELESKDSKAPSASWQMEIPVKHNNEVHNLHLHLAREWVDEKQENTGNTNIVKMKQWSVTLRFDLPQLGEFCAQLAIVGSSVSATLWAAREKTLEKVRKQIESLREQLENEGINVKYLQCIQGMPPQKPMALSYSLIDIKT